MEITDEDKQGIVDRFNYGVTFVKEKLQKILPDDGTLMNPVEIDGLIFGLVQAAIGIAMNTDKTNGDPRLAAEKVIAFAKFAGSKRYSLRTVTDTIKELGAIASPYHDEGEPN